MTEDRSDERDIRAWLAGPLDQLPDLYLDAALQAISATKQRRPAWPAWRQSNMMKSARYLAAGAAAILVVALGWVVLSGGGGVGGPGASPSTPASKGATPSPMPTPDHQAISVATFSLPFTATIPAEWVSDPATAYKWDAYDSAHSDVGHWGVNLFTNVMLFADPCHPSQGFRTLQPAPTPAAFVAALKALPGITVGDPVPYQSPGHSGLLVDIQVIVDPTTQSCELGSHSERILSAGPDDHDLGINDGYQLRWYVTVVKGSLVVIEAWTGDTPLAGEMGTIRPVVDSITFQ